MPVSVEIWSAGIVPVIAEVTKADEVRRAVASILSRLPSFQTATGKTSVVTDEIDRFTETGILLKSCKLLHADIIISATGFGVDLLGDIEFAIDGKPLVFSDTVT